MKKIIQLCPLLLLSATMYAQPNINSWIRNTNGQLASEWYNNGGNPITWTFTNLTDSANVLKVCYNTDTIWVYSQGLTDTMGKWLNPGNPVAQHVTYRFPRNPTVATTKVISSKLGAIGLLLNGVAMYGLSNANSWTGTTNATPQQGGQGVWNVEVGLSEGFVLDSAFGAHPQQQGIYHSHTTPYRLYDRVPATQHSPIVGYAFDGYPVYGPYGYVNPLDSTSGITRMKTGYSLRNITTRTTLSDGTTASQAGPDVNSTYPIGTYCEDYEWLAGNGGDLDEYNGRYCVTPEYPSGTYAYFVTIDAAGAAAFPYYVGIYYYGQPDAGDLAGNPMTGNGISVPSTVTNCLSATDVKNITTNNGLQIYPNPSTGNITILGNNHPYTQVAVYNSIGQKVYGADITGNQNHTISLSGTGVYFLRCENPVTGVAATQQVLIRQ